MWGNQNLAEGRTAEVHAWPGENEKVQLTFDSGSGIQISVFEILPILCNI